MTSTTSIVLQINGPSGDRRVAIDRRTTLIVGRGVQADIPVLLDTHFSRQHFRLEIDPPSCRVVDLQSYNGTYVNGLPVEHMSLNHGDVISGGKTRVVVTMPATSDADQTATLRMPMTRRNLRSEPEVRAIRANSAINRRGTQRFGNYEILEEIGRGTTAVVYLARHLSTRQAVALKVMTPARKIDGRQAKAFLREANALANLNHRRIVRFHEIGFDGRRLFLAMEHVVHRALHHWAQWMSPADRIRLACGAVCQTLDALDYAHGRGFCHRDVKPTNILLSRFRGRLAVKLADFDLAKSFADAGISGDGEASSRRRTSAFCAPEQRIDPTRAHPSSDLFSAGATLYYFLCGKCVYDVSGGCLTVSSSSVGLPVPLSSRRCDAPEELVALVDRAIAAEPARRFSSASQMRSWLNPFLQKSYEPCERK